MLAFPKPESTHREKRQKRAAREAHWQRMKKQVKARDGHRCRVCGSRDDVDVHHIKFRSAGGEDSTRNCACMCRVCHDDVHGYRLTLSGDADKTLRVIRL